VVEHAVPAEAVVAEVSAGYDLVVIGVGREWGLEHRLFGLQSEVILSRSVISVLVVRGAAERPTELEASSKSALLRGPEPMPTS
jgi:nucleotide-binding universal stress UspA family protein